LFDQTRRVHRLGAEERALLHAAAMLHDVGAFVSYNRHHKHTYYLLYHADLPGFTDRERELIATVARYHRRSVPKDRHEQLQLLTPEERNVVRRLAAILRVADGLDRGHRRHVRRVDVARGRRGGLRIDVWAEAGSELEVWSSQQKADLLAEMCGGPIRFRLHVARSPLRPRAATIPTLCAMRFVALATNYDDTLAENRRVVASTEQALERLRASGRKLLLVTG